MKQKKYFGTDGIRGMVGQFPITPEFMLKLGWAAGKALGKQGKVVIGKDTRISGYLFESVLEAGLTAAGVDSYLVGPMPTPAIAFLTRSMRANAGIVISASHNAYPDNGIKFFSADGTKLPDDVEFEIESLIDQEMETLPSELLGKAYRIDDAITRYSEFCKASVADDFSLKGMKIVLDCAHGATYQIAPQVFAELGAEITTIGASPDGLNINLNCGATSLKVLSQTVVEQKADLGIAFDGDGDRVMMIDSKGTVVNGDELVLIMARYQQKAGILKGGVAGTLMTNLSVEKALSELNIPFERTNVGDRYVMESLKNNQWTIGGESSGHVISLEHNSTGDGIVAALQVLTGLQCLDKSLGEMTSDYPLFPQTLINIRTEKAKSIMQSKELVKLVKKAEAELGERGRVLIRASGTEPLVRVMVEADEKNLAQSTAEHLAKNVTEM